jgi:hypothetical protein
MPIGLMFVYGALEHGFQYFIDGFNLPVRLRVVWGSEFMSKLSLVDNSVNTSFSKCLPWSETSWRGLQNE